MFLCCLERKKKEVFKLFLNGGACSLCSIILSFLLFSNVIIESTVINIGT